MYKKIERDNKIFESPEFQKDKYKFNIVSKILSGDEVLLYSDEENYFLARNKVGMPTWIWTKDGLNDKQILEEIKEVMSKYLTDLAYDQFTCKKEYYNFLTKSGYEKLNREDYFELGFLTCNRVKSVKQTDGTMVLCTQKENEDLLSLFVKFTEFANKTLKSSKEDTLEEGVQYLKKMFEDSDEYEGFEIRVTDNGKNEVYVDIAFDASELSEIMGEELDESATYDSIREDLESNGYVCK